MPRKREPVDDVLDAIVWMRRKSKKHEAVDDFIDALLTMRRNTKKKVKKVGKRQPDAAPASQGNGSGARKGKMNAKDPGTGKRKKKAKDAATGKRRISKARPARRAPA